MGTGWEGGGYSKRSCPLVRVALIFARSILYNVKKQLWCLIFSTRLHALRVRSFSFRSLFVFLCRSGSQRRSCCATRGASSMTSSTSQSKKEAHGLLALHVAGKRTMISQSNSTDVNMDVNVHVVSELLGFPWRCLKAKSIHVRFCP